MAPHHKPVRFIRGGITLLCVVLGALSLLATGFAFENDRIQVGLQNASTAGRNSTSPVRTDSDNLALTCPANTTQATDPNTCTRIFNYSMPPPDAGGTVTCTPVSGSSFPLGTTAVTCQEKNAGGAVLSACHFDVTIQDREMPTFTCPLPVEAAASETACQAAVPNLINGLVVSDNCSAASQVSLTQNPSTGTLIGKGDHNVEIVARDAAGNERRCTTVFRVLDRTKPRLSGLQDLTINNIPGRCDAVLTYVSPTASDSCDGTVPVSCSPASGTSLPVGVHTVNCSAQDQSGNRTTGSFQATIKDSEPPLIQCPTGIEGLLAQNPLGAIAVFGAPTVSDNCGVRPPSCERLSGTTFPIGSTINRCTVSDIHDNQAACSFKVEVIGPRFTLIAKGESTSDFFQIVTCRTGAFHYGYWEYHRVVAGNPDEIYYGYASSITDIIGTIKAEDSTSKDYEMKATFNPYSGVATAEVTLRSSGTKRRLVATDYKNEGCK
jgi:HYR domain